MIDRRFELASFAFKHPFFCARLLFFCIVSGLTSSQEEPRDSVETTLSSSSLASVRKSALVRSKVNFLWDFL